MSSPSAGTWPDAPDVEYEALDLSPWCNAGVELYAPGAFDSGGTYLEPRPDVPPIGRQSFHGFPFLVGGDDHADPERCFVAFGPRAGSRRDALDIPVGKTVRHVLFAHALLDTEVWRGAPIGRAVIRYDFRFDDGTIVSVPIRERFEIGHIPLPWGQYPFLCLPDQRDHLEPRLEGPWSRFGFRQTEVAAGLPQGYFVWAWPNPHPELTLAAIEVTPVSPVERTTVVAAITLSQLEESPVLRETARPIRITLADPHDAAVADDVEVRVDRGVASYAYPLPREALEETVPEMRGFGAPKNEGSSPSYVRIASLPSGTVTVSRAGEELGRASWSRLVQSGSVDAGRVRFDVLEHEKNWVTVEVVDDETGERVPCRIAFHSPAGVPYPPHGHHAPVFSNQSMWNIDVGGDVALGQISYAYIDGRCEGWLPRGRVLVDVARGYEYEAKREWVTISPDQRHLVIRIARWIDMNAQRYFSGDTHVHFLSTQGALTEARAEDLNVVNLLLSQWGHLFSNTEEFTGQPFVDRERNTIVHASQENRQHMLGHLSLLGLTSPVMPWGSGGPGEAEIGGGLDTSLSRWADAAHAQGGTVVVPHIPTPNGEAAVLIATGRADAVEMLDFLEYEHLEYYRYLNGGYRLPLVGGTDKMSNETPVGLYRTYVHIPDDEEFTYDSWLRALRGGNTFLSGGAMLWLTIEGRPIGSTLTVRGGGRVEVQAVARSMFPLHTLQIVERGRVVAETVDTAGAKTLHLHEHLEVTQDTWFVARVSGPNYTATPHYDERGRGIMAHTSPIYATVGSDYRLLDPATAQYMLTLISGGLSYVRHHSPQHDPQHTTHHHGLPDHIGYIEEPFREAAEALHKRMHDLGIPH